MSPQHPFRALKPTALFIAKMVSQDIFGSTEAVRGDFYHIGSWEKDGTLRAISFWLNHRLRIEDVSLNPKYIRVVVGEDDSGELVFEPYEIMGERRERKNYMADRRGSPGRN
jgi:hypothetical protein